MEQYALFFSSPWREWNPNSSRPVSPGCLSSRSRPSTTCSPRTLRSTWSIPARTENSARSPWAGGFHSGIAYFLFALHQSCFICAYVSLSSFYSIILVFKLVLSNVCFKGLILVNHLVLSQPNYIKSVYDPHVGTMRTLNACEL